MNMQKWTHYWNWEIQTDGFANLVHITTNGQFSGYLLSRSCSGRKEEAQGRKISLGHVWMVGPRQQQDTAPEVGVACGGVLKPPDRISALLGGSRQSRFGWRGTGKGRQASKNSREVQVTCLVETLADIYWALSLGRKGRKAQTGLRPLILQQPSGRTSKGRMELKSTHPGGVPRASRRTSCLVTDCLQVNRLEAGSDERGWKASMALLAGAN